MGRPLDRTKRYISERLLRGTLGIMYHAYSELWRLGHEAEWASKALTEKEQDYLLKRLALFDRINSDLVKLADRMRDDCRR